MHATRKNGVPLSGEALHHIEVIVPTTHPWICSIAVSLKLRAQRGLSKKLAKLKMSVSILNYLSIPIPAPLISVPRRSLVGADDVQ